jgi:hypothetical protein
LCKNASANEYYKNKNQNNFLPHFFPFGIFYFSVCFFVKYIFDSIFLTAALFFLPPGVKEGAILPGSLVHLKGRHILALKAEKIAGPGKRRVPTDAEIGAAEAIGRPGRGRRGFGGVNFVHVWCSIPYQVDNDRVFRLFLIK